VALLSFIKQRRRINKMKRLLAYGTVGAIIESWIKYAHAVKLSLSKFGFLKGRSIVVRNVFTNICHIAVAISVYSKRLTQLGTKKVALLSLREQKGLRKQHQEALRRGNAFQSRRSLTLKTLKENVTLIGKEIRWGIMHFIVGLKERWVSQKHVYRAELKREDWNGLTGVTGI
jgi:hypothetical protein